MINAHPLRKILLLGSHESLYFTINNNSFKKETNVIFVCFITGDTGFNTDNFELGSLVGTICYIMIALGVVLLAISFVGCFGACCNLTTVILVVYVYKLYY